MKRRVLALFQFKINGVDPGTGLPIAGMLTHHVICDQAEANKEAAKHERIMAQLQPERKVKVTPVGREQVGPFIQDYIEMLVAANRRHEIAARLLAASLAERDAKASLELNPNLPQIADKIMRDVLSVATEALQREAQSGIVGADGNPVKTGGRA